MRCFKSDENVYDLGHSNRNKLKFILLIFTYLVNEYIQYRYCIYIGSLVIFDFLIDF